MPCFATAATVLRSYLTTSQYDTKRPLVLRKYGPTWVICDRVTSRPDIELFVHDRAFGESLPEIFDAIGVMRDEHGLVITTQCYEIGVVITFEYKGLHTSVWFIGSLQSIADALIANLKPEHVEQPGQMDAGEFLLLLSRVFANGFETSWTSVDWERAPYYLTTNYDDTEGASVLAKTLADHPFMSTLRQEMETTLKSFLQLPSTKRAAWDWLNGRLVERVYILPHKP